MLKITETFKDEKTVILRLDGKIVGTRVSELERLCLYYRDRENKTVVLDFSGVTFIDNGGVEMLESIKDKRMAIINCSLFIRSLLSNVVSSD